MQITRTSMLSGITSTVEIAVTQVQIDAWIGGALIQNAMPNLTEAEREFIMTGATDEEWDEEWSDQYATDDEPLEDEPAF